MNNKITIREYLNLKGIEFKEVNSELLTRCLFNGCDDDSGTNEMHLYFNVETGQYQCKKCGESGNMITLQKHLGDTDKFASSTRRQSPKKINVKDFSRLSLEIVNKYHQALPDHIRKYLNTRGINDEIIVEEKLGWGNFYGKNWITIPIKNIDGKYIFFKLRKDPEDVSHKIKYKFYPQGSEASIYGWDSIKARSSEIVICEGEFDRLILSKFNIPAITSTAGAATFNKEWFQHLRAFDDIYVAFDKDEAGEKGSERLISKLAENLPEACIYKITLPDRMTDGKDISDYFNLYSGNRDEFMCKLPVWRAGLEPINEKVFAPMNSEKLAEILCLTIKEDRENKIIAFLCQLSAFTEDAQFNVSFNAPSSTGKSYIPTEVARLFPEKNVWELAQCSPTAFFHDFGQWDEKRNLSIVDLSRKIIIFLDQPHNELLARLRPILSHDKKEILSKITDKSQLHGLRTKNILIKGFPAVIFCTASLNIDEQEGTRFMLLSPETTQEKIRSGISQKIEKELDSEAFHNWLESNPDRKLLKERIRAISRAKIKDIQIKSRDELDRIFLKDKQILKPRHQRDIGKLISMIKTFALLNLWFRERDGDVIIANDDDIKEGVALWEKISESQDYNLPPYVLKIFQEIILPAYEKQPVGNISKRKIGLTRNDIIKKHYQVYQRPILMWTLRSQIIPMLEGAGLITEEIDPSDKRQSLIYPSLFETDMQENNSEQDCGVTIELPLIK